MNMTQAYFTDAQVRALLASFALAAEGNLAAEWAAGAVGDLARPGGRSDLAALALESLEERLLRLRALLLLPQPSTAMPRQVALLARDALLFPLCLQGDRLS